MSLHSSWKRHNAYGKQSKWYEMQISVGVMSQCSKLQENTQCASPTAPTPCS